MKKIFISGAAGYIGGNLVNFLAKKNYKVFCLSRKKKSKQKNKIWIKGNLNGDYQKYLEQSDLLIHCAVSGVYKKENSKKINQVNYSDTINFLMKAYKANCKNWIILGSAVEYGHLKTKAFSASKSQLKPIDTYGKSKVKLFRYLKKNYIKMSCKILYLRIFHTYGGNEPKKRLYPGLLNAARKNLNFEMTKGEGIRDFIHIDQVVKKIFKSFHFFKGNFFFKAKHVCSGKKMTVKKFALKVWKKNNAKKKIFFGKIKKKSNYHSMYSDASSKI